MVEAAMWPPGDSEGFYRSIFDLSSLSTIVYDGNVILCINDAAAKMFGLTSARAAIGRSVLEFVHSDSRAAVTERLKMMLASGESVLPLVERFLRADGSVFEGEAVATPVRWRGGTVIHVVVQDISGLEEARRRLTDSEERFAAIMERAPIGMQIYRLEPNGELIFTEANPAADRILGVPSSRFVGRDVDDAFPGMQQAVTARYREIAAQGGTYGTTQEDYFDATISGSFEVHAFQIGQGWLAVMFWDVTERIHNTAQLESYRGRLEQLVDERSRELAEAYRDKDAITEMAVRAVGLRDPYTAGHQRRVAQLAGAIARKLGLTEEIVDRICIAGKLHDVGKLSIPAEILSKPGKLLPAEYELVKGHAQAAHELLDHLDIGWPLADMVGQHHERLDGSGYPAGLKGDGIMLEARILAVADVVEAISSHRPYRPSLGLEYALAEISMNRVTHYDSNVVDACVLVMSDGFEFEDVV